MAATAVTTRRRIIPRPRLTRLLDENPARIKLLVAPAGYGKTTLAQQWLADPSRRDVWYRGGPASADVAALAAGIAMAASEIVPEAGKRMRQRISAVGHPEEDVDVLAELFAEDVQAWPSDAWLAVDDYHFAMEASASERFIELVSQQTPLRMVVTSRRRPGWATARRVLYGELQEIGREALAMDDGEAAAVLDREGASALLKQSQGWPAVIGLAALTATTSMPEATLPATLYQYFAEEILSAADQETQEGLIRLALAGQVDLDLAQSVLAPANAERTLREGVRLGVLVLELAGTYTVHPLFREFLETHLRSTGDRLNEAAYEVGNHLLARNRWDEAFDLADRFNDLRLAERVLAGAMERLLRDGRVATLSRWLERPFLLHTDSAVVSLVEAELAFRRAEHARAEVFAAQAATRFASSDPLLPRALARAGQSALLSSREREGLDYLKRAQRCSRSANDTREAVIGLYFAASELGLPDAAEYLRDLQRMDDGSAETVLRLGVAQLTQATREGGMASAIRQARLAEHLVEQASDPLASTSFLHMLANALNLTGRYDEAAETINSLLDIAKRYRVDMPVPHALLNRALSEHGRRLFAAAHKSLDQVADFVPPGGDVYLSFSASAIRARLLLSERRLAEAIDAVDRPADRIPSPPLRSEYLATQALVSASHGEHQRPLELLEESTAIFPNSVESRVLGASALAIGAGEDHADFPSAARAAWDAAVETENYDGLVCGYRSYPPMLRSLLELADPSSILLEVIARARDERLARAMGARVRLSSRYAADRLTPREADVFGLLRRGLSNRAIAEALVISEATVKVHVHHIYEKLGVRSRAEALAQDLSDGSL